MSHLKEKVVITRFTPDYNIKVCYKEVCILEFLILTSFISLMKVPLFNKFHIFL